MTGRWSGANDFRMFPALRKSTPVLGWKVRTRWNATGSRQTRSAEIESADRDFICSA